MCQGVAKVFKGLLGLFTSANQESFFFFFFLTLGCIYFGEVLYLMLMYLEVLACLL